MEYARNHGVEVANQHPRLEIPLPARAKAAQIINGSVKPGAPVVAIQTGPTWPVKEWPRESWISLVGALQGSGCETILQLGAGSHLLKVGAMENQSIPGTVSLVDKLTLEESAAVISRASFFVGVDSGLLHIATALGIPSVGIFGPTSPEIILSPDNASRGVVSPISCQGCHHRVPRLNWITGCPHDIACMAAISPEAVLKACRLILEPWRIKS